jgi:hypothetical protein
MFLRCTARTKGGKEHRYFSIVENKRVAGGRVVQRHVLYPGEINTTQEAAWRKTIGVFEDGQPRPATIALIRAERVAPVADDQIVRIRLGDLQLRRPRQWGGCWLAGELDEQLGLDRFWAEYLPPSRKGTRWDLVLRTKGRLSRREEPLLERSWQEVREGIEVKLLEQGAEVYVLARSRDRIGKERGIRRRQLKRLWAFYIQLTHVEEAFKHLKGDLGLRPIFHQTESRIEAHIFVAFLAYCLHVTLQRRLRDLAPGLTPRSVLEKCSAMQMIADPRGGCVDLQPLTCAAPGESAKSG